MKLLNKPDAFAAAFHLEDGNKLRLKIGVTLDGKEFAPDIVMPAQPKKGTDYIIVEKNGKLRAIPGFFPEAVGGFHLGLSGAIKRYSIWDGKFRPNCPDPRGQVLVQDLFWGDIYPLNTEAAVAGTSRAGLPIATGKNPTTIGTAGMRMRGLNIFEAEQVMDSHSKQLFTAAEYALAMRGIKEGARAPRLPTKIGHIKGLESDWGIELGCGVIYVWGREKTQHGYCRILGGSWRTVDSGPRRLDFDIADYSIDYIGARGRCDHLILV